MNLLKYFFPEGNEKTIKEVQDRSKYSYERVYTKLKTLEEKKIIQQRKVGKTILYKPELNNLNLRWAFYNYNHERISIFQNKYPLIFKALSEIQCFGILLIFGSYSKNKEHKNSDVDILIASDNREIIKEINNLKRKYNFKFSPIIVKPFDFNNIKQDNPELWQDLKDNALILEGEEWFYHWLYQQT